MKVVIVILNDIIGWLVNWLIWLVVVWVVIIFVFKLFSVVCNMIVLIVMIEDWNVIGKVVFRCIWNFFLLKLKFFLCNCNKGIFFLIYIRYSMLEEICVIMVVIVVFFIFILK